MKPTPLLPEATFTPLPQARLEQMIDHALSHSQQPAAGNVIAFGPRQAARNWMFGSGMAAMAASIMLTFMLTPQMNTGSLSLASTSAASISSQADVSDMILLDTLGA